MRKTAPVRLFMSRQPEEIDRREELAVATRRMAKREIRHVPVMDGAHLFGILSHRDLHDAWVRHGRDAARRPVGDVCTRQVLSVSPLTPVREVAVRMLERGVGSALVVDSGIVVGIFTSTDALRVLADR